jgi:hypothetical protein
MTISATQVQEAYLAYFGRPADAGGLAYWQTQSDVSTMDAGFAASTEYANLYANMNPTQRVTQVYQDVLGRAPDSGGLAYWTGQLSAGSQTVSSLVATILNVVLTEPAGSVDLNTIDNRLTYAASFTTAVSASAADIADYSGVAASDVARTAMSAVVDTQASITAALAALPTSVTAVTAAGVVPGTTLDISGYTGLYDLSNYIPPVSVLNITSASANVSLLNLASAVTINDNYPGDENSTLTLAHTGTAQSHFMTVNYNSESTVPLLSTISLNSTGDSAVSFNTPASGGGISHYAPSFGINESDNALNTLILTGGDYITLNNVATDVGANIAVGTTVASSLVKIDASGTTGGLDIEAGAGATAHSVSYSGLVIYGGSKGIDDITNWADNGMIIGGAQAGSSSIYTNDSYNHFEVWGNNATIDDSKSASTDILTLHGANDSALLGPGPALYSVVPIQVYVLDASNVLYNIGTDNITVGTGITTVFDELVLAASANGNILAINGSINNCSLNFSSATPQDGSLGAAASVAGAQSLDQAINIFTGTDSGKVVWFQYGGNTYIEAVGQAYSNYAASEIVKLTGLVDLSHSAITNGLLHI